MKWWPCQCREETKKEVICEATHEKIWGVMALHGTMHSPKMTMNLQQISNRWVRRHKHHQQRYHKHHYHLQQHHQQHYWQIPSPSATDASNIFTMCTSKHYCVNKQSHSSPSIWGTNPPNNTKHLPKMDVCKLPQKGVLFNLWIDNGLQILRI